MRGVLLMTTGAAALLVALGCGGAWNEATAEAVSDQASEFRGKLMQASPSPERDAVDKLLEDVQQQPQGIGIIEFATFGAEVEQALGDGTIDADELAALQKSHSDMRAP